MNVLHIVGPSDSGKTRLIEALIPLLPVRQVLKWSHHNLLPDSELHDTGRFQRLGMSTLLVAPNGLVGQLPITRPLIYQWLAHFLGPEELLVVEGDKDATTAKIWMGPTEPPSTIVVSLVISATRPQLDVQWLESTIPPSDTDIAQLASYLAERWAEYTYHVDGGYPK